MMKFNWILAFLMIFVFLLSGCGVQIGDTGLAMADDNAPTPTADTDLSDMFTSRDLSFYYDESASALIQLNGDSAACTSDAVRISGGTITILDEGTYILSGTLNDGMIIVNADQNDKLQLVLNGASINSNAGAPVYINEADKVVITLTDGSDNTLSNGGVFTAMDGNSIDGTVFSKQDLSFNGSGRLTVVSPAGHGIVCKDDLVFTGGEYAITSASHGIDANDSVRATGTVFTIVSGKDGVHAENSDDENLGFVYVADGSFHIEAEGDGISAGAYIRIEDGSFNIVSGGGSANASQRASDAWGGFGGQRGGTRGSQRGGMNGGQSAGSRTDALSSATDDDTSTSIKGLKASGDLVINGGTFNIDAADDAVHSNASIVVNGASFDLASGDDGIHADDTLTVTAGTVKVTKCYEGMEALHIVISGGDISVKASDDGLNAAGGTDQSGFGGPRGNERFGGAQSSAGGSIVISGGSLYINASGDGLDANGSLTISGGTVIVSGPTSGDTSVLDYDNSGVITSGTFIGTGAIQMAQTFSSSNQGVIAVNASNQPAGTLITLTDSSGKAIISYDADQSFALVILSSPDIIKGETYTLTIGSNAKALSAS